ncbi:hypothetical protein LJC34_03120 [Oscillospiraceae bacterium OttesenSCG-928-G22]|nr:hypothetical protein [Oscillospiraceae bacterium OttesenSCG-928-G22]
MSQRRMTVLAVLAAAILTVAIISSFFLTSALASKSPPIVLPPEPSPGASGGTFGEGLPSNAPTPPVFLELTRENVKSVVETMSRPAAYTARYSVTTFWTGGAKTRAYTVSARDGAVKIVYADAAGNPSEHFLYYEGRVYIWNEGSRLVYEGSADIVSSDDAVGIPTYESLLSTDDDDIRSAGYATHGGDAALLAETGDSDSEYRTLYYVSLESGLLLESQTYSGETLVRNAVQISLSLDAPDAETFDLPDGSTMFDEENR